MVIVFYIQYVQSINLIHVLKLFSDSLNQVEHISFQSQNSKSLFLSLVLQILLKSQPFSGWVFSGLLADGKQGPKGHPPP